MQNTLVKVPMVLWRMTLTLTFKIKILLKSKILSNSELWVCSHNNSSPVQARIAKFGPEVQNNLVNIPIVLVGWSQDHFTVLNVSQSRPSACILIYEAKGNSAFNIALVFSCDQAALRTPHSVGLSVCLSVRLSVCLSVCRILSVSRL